MLAEAGKVTFKGKDKFLLKSNGDELWNEDFPKKETAIKCLTLSNNCNYEALNTS